MEIKVLGKGCPKCRRLEQLTQEAIDELGITATIAHVTDMDAIMAYDILGTPALVIDENVVSSGRLPRRAEIVEWLKATAV